MSSKKREVDEDDSSSSRRLLEQDWLIKPLDCGLRCAPVFLRRKSQASYLTTMRCAKSALITILDQRGGCLWWRWWWWCRSQALLMLMLIKKQPQQKKLIGKNILKKDCAARESLLPVPVLEAVRDATSREPRISRIRVSSVFEAP